MSTLPSRTLRPQSPCPVPPGRLGRTGIAYAAVLLAALASLGLQPDPSDGTLHAEPLLTLAAWANATTDWAAALAEEHGAAVPGP